MNAGLPEDPILRAAVLRARLAACNGCDAVVDLDENGYCAGCMAEERAFGEHHGVSAEG